MFLKNSYKPWSILVAAAFLAAIFLLDSRVLLAVGVVMVGALWFLGPWMLRRLTWLSWVVGAVWRIPLPGGGGVLPLDLAVGLVMSRQLFIGRMAWKRLLGIRELWPWWGFLLVGVLGTVALWLTPGSLHPVDGLAHLARLAFYSIAGLGWLGLAVFDIRSGRWLEYSVWAVLGLGALQLLLMPDLRVLENYGWDPHVGRLVSTVLDPNLLSGILLLPLALYLLRWFRQKRLLDLSLFLLVVAAILLTKSLAGIVAAVALAALILLWQTGWKKVWWTAALVLSLFAQMATFVLPFVLPPDVADVSWQKRLQSWRIGTEIAMDHPFVGVGYNNLRSIKTLYPLIEAPNENSAAGIDSSMVQVAATTGIAGLVLWLMFWLYLLGSLLRIARRSEWAESLVVAFPALLAASSFTNLFFFMPFIWLAFNWLALALRHNYNRSDISVRL